MYNNSKLLLEVFRLTIEEIKKLDQTYYMNTFGERIPLCFDHGEGIRLFDCSGREYYDFFAGIAVNALGYGNREFTDSLCSYLQNHLPHTSNLYYVETQAKLAEKLVQCSCADRVFFANSGAEANEGAVKLARIYQYKKNRPQKNKIITLINSFHGRTMATVAATGQEKYQKPYRPLTPGFVHIPINDIDALKRELDGTVCAVMVEPIQGESGVYPLEDGFAKTLRKLCSDDDILLIFDEVQTGIGRTGKLFAYEHFGIEPDIFTLAKALGNGIPVGAVCAKNEVAKAFSPGDHGSTFGGNGFACQAGLTVLSIIEKEKLVQNAAEVGGYFKENLQKIQSPLIQQVRGVGLMIGIELQDGKAKAAQQALLERGFVTGCVGEKILRLLPPLILQKSEADLFTECFESVLKLL